MRLLNLQVALSSKTKLNGFSIGNFRANQRKKYKELQTIEEKKVLLEEFNIVHKDYLSIEQRKNTK